MKGLLLRLSALDADAESAVRVIAYFDALVAARTDAAGLVRATATLAECGAGLETPRAGRVRYRADGSPAPANAAGEPGPAEPDRVSGWTSVGADGRVWLERSGPARALDEIVLERMAIAAQVVDARARPSLHIADPALVELALSERESDEDRARALRLLGLLPDVAIRAVGICVPAGVDVGVQAVALVARGRLGSRTVRVAVLGRTAAVLLQDRAATTSPAGELRRALAERAASGTGRSADDQGHPGSPTGRDDGAHQARVGVGGPVAGLEARASWRQARLALRFAAPGAADTAVVDYAELGSLALLADLPVDRLRRDPDVRALESLAGSPAGAADVAVLEAFCRAGSLRQAASGLHLHHSSVAARVAHLEDVLGWRLDEPEGRFRAHLALLARRLATTA
jgi:hypothetical protein